MTREEFIRILDREGYSYEIEGDKLIVTGDSVYLGSLETLPPDVVFRNKGNVFFRSLETIPSGVEFKNEGDVNLNALKTLSTSVEFRNGGNVFLGKLKAIPPGVVFRNEWSVELKELIGGWLHYWEGNIEGVDNKRLLNIMIKQGVFI